MSETMHFTGERVIPGEVDPNLLLEHLVRYQFAAQFASGQRILDAACGVGYGSFLLSKSARSVFGLDISAETIAYAAEHYHAPNLTFLAGDCCSPALPDESFDRIVAFEIIEHLSRPEEFLREMSRLLARQGFLILSTPNRLCSEELRQEPNPFHQREFDPAELRALLETIFPHVELATQDHSEGMTIVFPERPLAVEHSLQLGNDSLPPVDAGQYLVALCSKVPLRMEWPNPFFVASGLGNVLSERSNHLKIYAEEVQGLKDRLRDLRDILKERDSHLQISQQETEAVKARLAAVEETLAERDSHVKLAELEIQGFRSRISTLDSMLAERDAHMETALAEAGEQRQRIEVLESELGIKGAHIGLLQEEAAAARSRVEVLDSELEVKARHISLLQTQMEREQEQAKRIIGGLTEQLDRERLQAQTTATALTDQLDRERLQAQTTATELTDQLDRERVKAQFAITALTSQLDAEKTAAGEERQRLQAEIDHTEQQLDEARILSGKLQNTLDQLDQSILFRFLNRVPFVGGYLRRIRHSNP